MAVYINDEKVAEAENSRSLKGSVGMQVHYLKHELDKISWEIEPYRVWFKDIEIKAVK